MTRIGVISLGCPKNRVDAEEILGELCQAGYGIETDLRQADVLIVNTCGFIQDAIDESMSAIHDAVRYKTNGACRSVIVTGCLAQRCGADLSVRLPKVDAIVGLGRSGELPVIISRTLAGERVLDFSSRKHWWLDSRNRVLSTPLWTAYLRIADGCDNRCTYCTIPSIRGSFRSRSEETILEEAYGLAELGVKELILVAQDTTRFGLDTHGRLCLSDLIERLSAVDVHWIRLLYCYPNRVTDDLIHVIATNNKVCKYLDIPLQHCSERILARMGRRGSRKEYVSLVSRIREECPGIALRTTLMVGFAGESDADFEELLDFVREVRFDRLGAFIYSPEEGTPAAKLRRTVGYPEAKRRLDRLMTIQQQISLEKNRNLIGKRLEVLIESQGGNSCVGRSYRDAPEIDGIVRVLDCSASPGTFVQVEVTMAEEYDLIARPVKAQSENKKPLEVTN